MKRIKRAVGFTAAVVTLAIGATVAPSLAYEAETAPAVHYIEHAAASFETPGEFGLNRAEENAQLAHDVDFSTPVAAHAVAEVEPAAARVQPAVIDRDSDRKGRSLAQLVRDYAGSETPDSEFECLATAVYYESKGEPLAGQLTVAEVILNRADSGRFPSTICGVVKQPSQFSFVRGGRLPTPPRSSEAWRTAVAISHIAIEDLAEGAAPRALFFHARRVSPGWRNLTRVASVGNHVFYR
ncbi:MAG: cell wall hydrolase [Allosphingosinicella sp.]|uniref:cell wall hydrolase n=1 Tax=Allosphingosinicella sp. TaxID=2823234 RepID=UPI0039590EC7